MSVSTWKFQSTWEQREAFRDDFPYREDFTRAEALAWASRANHLWRGTMTVFTVEERDGRYIVLQGLIH